MFKEEETPKYQKAHRKEIEAKEKLKSPHYKAMYGLANMSKEKKDEIIKKGHEARKEACAKRKRMSQMFENALTYDKRRNIAESLVFALGNGNVRIQDRIRILELILKLTGEIEGKTTKTEIDALGDVVLQIN